MIECFTARGTAGEADLILCATQDRSVSHVLALVRVLVQGRRSGSAAVVVDRAVSRWPADAMATMIAGLYSTDHLPQAAQALIGSMRHSAVATRFLLRYPDEAYPGAEAVLRMVTATGSPERAAHLLTCLESSELLSLAEAVFQQTLTDKPTGHAGQFLRVLDQSGSAVVQEAGLYARACAVPGQDMAPLLLALAAAQRLRAVDAVA